MSKMLSQVKSAAPAMPPRIVLYAPEKFGKTSFGCYPTKPVFLMTAGETGLLSLIESNRVPATPHFPEAKCWSDVWAAVVELRQEQHEYQTLVIDTGNGAELLCAKEICDDHFGGEWGAYASYGRGNEMASKAWGDFLAELDLLRAQRKLQILILQHAKVKTFADPAGKDWDQWRPEAIEKCWALTHKWADAILFGGFKVQIDKDGKPKGEKRYLRTEASGAIVAGNRYGLPAELMPAGSAADLWASFAGALEKAKTPPAPKPAKKNAAAQKTPEEKAAWFRQQIPLAHDGVKSQAGEWVRTPEQQLQYLRDGLGKQGFSEELCKELGVLWFKEAFSMATSQDALQALWDQAEKQGFAAGVLEDLGNAHDAKWDTFEPTPAQTPSADATDEAGPESETVPAGAGEEKDPWF